MRHPIPPTPSEKTKVEVEIMSLTNQWYQIVGRDSHKDRDCHFYIEKKWSYGQAPVYSVQHDGYVWDEVVDETFGTADEAHRFLLAKLREMVAAESSGVIG